MVKLKDLFNGNNKIKIIVENEDYKSFLEYAKEEGCLWQNGEIIKPNIDKPGYTRTVVVTYDLFIYHPCSWMTQLSIQNIPEYLYKKIKEDNIVDEQFERTFRTERINKEYEEAKKLKAEAFRNKCEENRRISQIQLKNKDKSIKLRRYFFVRYKDNDELLSLYLLFKKYGYENIYDISYENINKDPKIILINNETMTFSPATILDCSCILKANMKLYTTESFTELLKNIYE